MRELSLSPVKRISDDAKTDLANFLRSCPSFDLKRALEDEKIDEGVKDCVRLILLPPGNHRSNRSRFAVSLHYAYITVTVTKISVWFFGDIGLDGDVDTADKVLVLSRSKEYKIPQGRASWTVGRASLSNNGFRETMRVNLLVMESVERGVSEVCASAMNNVPPRTDFRD